MLGFIIEEGESRTQCDIICDISFNWPPGGALLRQQHSLINSGPHTGPLSRSFWECRRCIYWNPKLNLNLSSVWHGMISPICNDVELTYSALHFRCICWSYVVWYSIARWFSLSRLGRGFPTLAFGWPYLFVVYVYYPMWEQVQVGMTVKRDLAIIKGRIKLSRSWRNDHCCWRSCSWISFSYWIFWVMILLWVLCLS